MTTKLKRDTSADTPKGTIRVTTEDWTEWAAVAASVGLTRSALIRESVRKSIRVIRALQSADNATPGHFGILSNAAQRSGTKGRSGGEAKGADDESPAKLGGLRSM